MTIDQWLLDASKKLHGVGIPSARLDALVLLGDALDQDKSWILAHGDSELSASLFNTLSEKLSKRAARYPLAYIRGHQEFYGREFLVNDHVLIPRPETEEIIDQLKALRPQRGQKLLDVGTGSGAIAVTAALETPLEVEAVDVSHDALEVAKQNAQKLQANVHFYFSNLLENTQGQYDFIVANLPYVNASWERSPETNAEPKQALFADDEGLALIKKLLDTSAGLLQPKAYMLLEADPEQHPAIIAHAKNYHLLPVVVQDYIIVLQLRS